MYIHMYIEIVFVYYFTTWLYYNEGYEDGNASDVMTGNHHHGNIPDDHHGNLDTMPGEEIEAVMRRQQAEVTELLAKSGEALRSVCQFIYSGTSLTATRVALIHTYNVQYSCIPVNRFSLIIAIITS